MAITHDQFIECLRRDVKESLEVFIDNLREQVRKTPINTLQDYLDLVSEEFQFDRDAARISVGLCLGLDLSLDSWEEYDLLDAKIREVIPDFDSEKVWGRLDS